MFIFNVWWILEESGKQIYALYSRNFQNVKLRLDFVKIWQFYSHSDFAWNQIGKFKGSKNFIFGNFRDSKPWKLVNSGVESCSKLPKITFLELLNSPKFDFTQSQGGSKIIKYQQSQALTSHFESFWSIVLCTFWWIESKSPEMVTWIKLGYSYSVVLIKSDCNTSLITETTSILLSSILQIYYFLRGNDS